MVITKKNNYNNTTKTTQHQQQHCTTKTFQTPANPIPPDNPEGNKDKDKGAYYHYRHS